MRVSSNSLMTDEESKTFGAELKRLREEAGFTGMAFSELIGASGGHISQIERGVKKPSPELAERIADVFGVTVDGMLGEKEDKPDDDSVREIRIKFGKTLKEHREAKGLPIAVVAGALGIPTSVYKEYEQGLCSITDREMDMLGRLLGIGEKPKVVEKTVTVEVPAEIRLDMCDTILAHIKDLQISEDEQKEVWRYFKELKLNAEERTLFG